MEEKDLAALVRRNENQFITGTTHISKYVDISLYEIINRIDAYLNSKFIDGDKDSLGNDKPFFNIVVAIRNIWMRATDIDRKNIKLRATKSTDTFLNFLGTIKLQEWMRKENFGAFLNEWGRTLATYGSAVVKFIESEGKLHSMVIPWNRLVVDPIDFDNDVVIECLELTPSQLRKRNYDKEQVEILIAAASTRKDIGGQQKDTKTGYIKVYEVHGELPLSMLVEGGSETEYAQQMHVISYVAGKNAGDYNDFTLYKGREEKNPYMITHLIKEDGRTMAIGAVENTFEAQWMVNHAKKIAKDQLDLASKLVFQTSDAGFVGRNALDTVENGDILIHEDNKPITQIQNNSHDITSIQNYGMEWKNLASEISGISESMMGNAAPSGTAWRQVEALLQESHSLFELMTENKGIALEQMLRIYVIPYLKKQLDTTDEIVATLEAYDIDRIDKKYVPYEATRRLQKKLIAYISATGEIPLLNEGAVTGAEAEVKDQLSQQGASRFFSPSELGDATWKELFKDFEWDIEIDVTGEQSDNQSNMATLSTVFQTIATNPAILENQQAKMLFNKILTQTGTVSPVELQEVSQSAPPVAPSGGQAPGMLQGLSQTNG